MTDILKTFIADVDLAATKQQTKAIGRAMAEHFDTERATLQAEIDRLSLLLTQERARTVEECAKVADEHGDHEAAAGNRARDNGRFNVGSHRDAGMEASVAIAIKIRSLAPTAEAGKEDLGKET